jgi:hypothetical protein
MGYHVEFVELVLTFLGQVEGLTDQDRSAIVDEIIAELSRDADRFLALYPLSHESLCFRYPYAYQTRRRSTTSTLSGMPSTWK